ncbi:MAG: hypothetical protein AABZ76_07260 [Pseudomonadota bacterium]|mgnify:FL=1
MFDDPDRLREKIGAFNAARERGEVRLLADLSDDEFEAALSGPRDGLVCLNRLHGDRLVRWFATIPVIEE